LAAKEMTLVTWMAGVSIGSWVVAAALVDASTRVAVLFGMLGPLAAVSVTWVLVERTFRRSPASLTALMSAGFALKAVFFGAYVAVMLKGLALTPAPFVVSFMSYFIGLYLIEALALRRLFSS
jgi:hypothetical protein